MSSCEIITLLLVPLVPCQVWMIGRVFCAVDTLKLELRMLQSVFTPRENFFHGDQPTIVKIGVGVVLGQKQEPDGCLTRESAPHSLDQRASQSCGQESHQLRVAFLVASQRLLAGPDWYARLAGYFFGE